ncbi:MAG: hypothetical protein WAL32_07505 [Terriglobales bacterium]
MILRLKRFPGVANRKMILSNDFTGQLANHAAMCVTMPDIYKGGFESIFILEFFEIAGT